jgi:hypothetical protein
MKGIYRLRVIYLAASLLCRSNDSCTMFIHVSLTR